MKEQEDNNQLELIQSVQKDEQLAVPMATNEFEGLSSQGLPGKMAKDADSAVLRVTIKVAFTKAHIANSRGFKAQDAGILIDELQKEILRSFGSIRLAEIGLAIHKGAVGEYGQIYNLNLNFFVTCIRTYMQSDKRTEATKKFLQGTQAVLLLQQNNKPTEAEMKQESKKNALAAFDAFKKQSYFNDFGNAQFNALADFGVISFEQSDIDEFWKAARKNVFAYYSRPAESIDRRNDNRKTLEALKANYDHTFFLIEVKKLALNKFFADMVAKNIELSDLIEA